MKIKVIKKAFYKNSLLEEGTVLNIKEKVVPSWATLAAGAEVAEDKNLEDDVEKTEQEDLVPVNNEGNVPEVTTPENPTQTEEENKPNEVNTATVNMNTENGPVPVQITVKDTANEISVKDATNETEEEVLKKLESLRDLAVENEVWLEVNGKLTAQEEIQLLTEELKKKNIEV